MPKRAERDEMEEFEDDEEYESGEEEYESGEEESDDGEEGEDSGEESEEDENKPKRAKRGEGKHRAIYSRFDFPHQRLAFLLEKGDFLIFEETETAYLLKATPKAMLPKYKNWFKNKARVFKENGFLLNEEQNMAKKAKTSGLLDTTTLQPLGAKLVRKTDSSRFAF
jgi:hypothetical protein